MSQTYSVRDPGTADPPASQLQVSLHLIQYLQQDFPSYSPCRRGTVTQCVV